MPAEARLAQELLEPGRRAVEAPHEARVQCRVGGVDGRGEGLDGPQVQGRVHGAGQELGRVGREGEGGDGVAVCSQRVRDGVRREREGVDVVVDAADEERLAVLGPLDLRARERESDVSDETQGWDMAMERERERACAPS